MGGEPHPTGDVASVTKVCHGLGWRVAYGKIRNKDGVGTAYEVKTVEIDVK